MDMKRLANVYIVFGVVIAALWPVVLEMAASVNVYEFLFFENIIAVIASLLLILFVRKLASVKETLKNKRNLGIILVVAILNYIIPDFGMLLGEHYISASLASIIFRTYPILMLLFLPLVLKERVTKYQVSALALGFLGIVLVIWPTGSTVLSSGWLLGVSLVFLVALATAAALAIMKRHVHETESALFLYNVVGFVTYTLIFMGAGMPLQNISSNGWTAILFTGIIYSVISAYGFYYALKLLKVTYITNLFYFAPFITFIFASLLLKEPITLTYVLSAGLIASGVLIQKFDKIGGSYAPSKMELRHVQIFDVTGAFVMTKEQEIARLIKSGGRALATKIGHDQFGLAEELAKGRPLKIITRAEKTLSREMDFIDDVLGIGAGEMAVVIAGETSECEKALGDILTRLAELTE